MLHNSLTISCYVVEICIFVDLQICIIISMVFMLWPTSEEAGRSQVLLAHMMLLLLVNMVRRGIRVVCLRGNKMSLMTSEYLIAHSYTSSSK